MSTQFVVMGVSGCGKSTLASALADEWGVPYLEGDQLHPEQNVAKMAAGIPLEDADRWPWLEKVGDSIAAASRDRRGAVASCSALRLSYRDILRTRVGPHLRFVMLDLPREALERRMLERTGHYMPPSLLESQLRTLERPAREPDVLIVDGTAPLNFLVKTVCEWRLALLKRGETW